jgi:hypothetical protein
VAEPREAWDSEHKLVIVAAANAVAAALVANADFDPVAYLDELIDAWEEMAVKEGEDIYVPQEWEDDVLELMATCE